MDTTIIAAIIGAIATLSAVWYSHYLNIKNRVEQKDSKSDAEIPHPPIRTDLNKTQKGQSIGKVSHVTTLEEFDRVFANLNKGAHLDKGTHTLTPDEFNKTFGNTDKITGRTLTPEEFEEIFGNGSLENLQKGKFGQ